VVTGLLPSFFNGNESFYSGTQASFPAYTQGYFAPNAAPSGEIPLAAVVGLLSTLRGAAPDLTDDATCLAANIATLESALAQGFGSPPLSDSEYQAAQLLSTTLPTAKYSDLYSLLLGVAAPDAINSYASQNFFSVIHNNNPCKTTPCSASALGLSAAAVNHPRVAYAYQQDQYNHVDFVSNYHPLALALTFGVVHRAYASDTYNWDVMFSSAAAAMSPPYSLAMNGAPNIFGTLLSTACDLPQADCDSTLSFFTRSINEGLNYYGAFIFASSTSVWCTQMISDSANCWPSACSTCDCN